MILVRPILARPYVVVVRCWCGSRRDCLQKSNSYTSNEGDKNLTYPTALLYFLSVLPFYLL